MIHKVSRDSRPYNGTSLSIWSRSLRLAAEQLEIDESDWEQEEKRLRVGTSKNVTVYIFKKGNRMHITDLIS